MPSLPSRFWGVCTQHLQEETEHSVVPKRGVQHKIHNKSGNTLINHTLHSKLLAYGIMWHSILQMFSNWTSGVPQPTSCSQQAPNIYECIRMYICS